MFKCKGKQFLETKWMRLKCHHLPWHVRMTFTNWQSVPETDSQMNGDLTVCLLNRMTPNVRSDSFVQLTRPFYLPTFTYLYFDYQPTELPPMGAGSAYQLSPSAAAAAHHSASAAAMMAHRHLAAAASVKSDPNIKIALENAELWQQFHQIGTEMIITKLGRWVIQLSFLIVSTI